jgi:hypothetical protein
MRKNRPIFIEIQILLYSAEYNAEGAKERKMKL